MDSTVSDMWRMVWSQDIYNIIMLTSCYENKMLKCVQYWPREGEVTYDDITVNVTSEVVRSEYTIRTIFIKEMSSGTSRHVIQYHYTAWPDKDVPDTPVSLVQFWRKVKQGEHQDRLPWLVHCSAGVGRTGTFIALDYLHAQARKEQQVGVFDCVNLLRTQRVNLVQTKSQYLFLHRAVMEALSAVGKSCQSEEFRQLYTTLQCNATASSKSKLQEEFEIIQQEAAVDARVQEKITKEGAERKDIYASSKLLENTTKNRDNAVLPYDSYRPDLITAVPGCNEYINAAMLPSFTSPRGLIITQHALPNTAVDLVRLIWDYNVSTVVMMGGPTPPDPKSEFWSGAAKLGPFSVKVRATHLSGFNKRTIQIKLQDEERVCHHFTYMNWPTKGAVPTDAGSILELIAGVEGVQQNDVTSPVVVYCINGAERSGIFCVLLTVLQRMNADREVAIAETMRLMRVRRKEIVPNYEQYKYCHEVILEYLENYEVYVNFT